MNQSRSPVDVGEPLREELSARLVEERSTIQARLHELRAVHERVEEHPEPLEEANSTVATRDVDTVLEEQFESRLEAVDSALGRVERGWLGSCEGCGSTIPVERLLAVPGTELCVKCQDRRTRRAR